MGGRVWWLGKERGQMAAGGVLESRLERSICFLATSTRLHNRRKLFFFSISVAIRMYISTTDPL